jgi:hypothetical protein
LPAPSGCTLQITNAALWLLKNMYQSEVYYQKAGVLLSELVPEGRQTDLFAYSSSSNKSGIVSGINYFIVSVFSQSLYRQQSMHDFFP